MVTIEDFTATEFEVAVPGGKVFILRTKGTLLWKVCKVWDKTGSQLTDKAPDVLTRIGFWINAWEALSNEENTCFPSLQAALDAYNKSLEI